MLDMRDIRPRIQTHASHLFEVERFNQKTNFNMKFLAALAAVVASTQASYIAGAYHGAIAPVAHAVPAVAPAVVPGPQVVGAVAQGPNVLPSRAHLPAPRVVEHAPQVAHHVEPVEQWGYP